MSQTQLLFSRRAPFLPAAAVGTPGYLAILAGAVGLAVFAPRWMLAGALLLAATAAARLGAETFRPLLRPRWIALCALLIAPSVFLAGPPDRSLLGIPYSTLGLEAAQYALLRMLLIFMAASIFTSRVEISALAAVFEKMRLPGLGFSMGVAMNLLPNLEQSALTTWRVLRMRGGFRRQRWNGLCLLAITMITQALNRAEEIALAAEARAFTPECATAYPLVSGKLDAWLIAASILAVASAAILRMVG